MSNETAVEGLHFLTQSPVRVRVLELLYDEKSLRKRDLKDRIDASRVTVRRNVDALEDRGWIETTGDGCEITVLGETVVEDVAPGLDTLNLVERLRPFVRWFPDDELAFDLRSLEEATIVVSDSNDPYAPVNRHIDALENADRFRCLLPAVGLPAMMAARDRVVGDGGHHEIVYSTDLAPTVRTRPEYRDLIEEMLECSNCDIFVSDREISFYLGLLEGVVQIGVEDDDGVPRALVETGANEVRAWAEHRYENYRSSADPFAL